MTITTEQAVALAERVGFPLAHPEWRKAVEQFYDLAEQQVIERLAQESVGEPEVVAYQYLFDSPYAYGEIWMNSPADHNGYKAKAWRELITLQSHRKAIATMQAQNQLQNAELTKFFNWWNEAEQRYKTAYSRGVDAAKTELQARVEQLEKFVAEVAAQKPEKPDYWSSCSQCEHNTNAAEDLIDAALSKESGK